MTKKQQKTLEERIAALELKNSILTSDTNQILSVILVWLILITIF